MAIIMDYLNLIYKYLNYYYDELNFNLNTFDKKSLKILYKYINLLSFIKIKLKLKSRLNTKMDLIIFETKIAEYKKACCLVIINKLFAHSRTNNKLFAHSRDFPCIVRIYPINMPRFNIEIYCEKFIMINNHTFHRFIQVGNHTSELCYHGKIIYNGTYFSLYRRNFINSVLINDYKHFKREEAIMRFEPYNMIHQYEDNLLYIYKKKEDIYIVLTKKHYNFKLFILFNFGWDQN